MVALREKKKELTYQKILEASWKLFKRQGIQNTKVGEIAKRANVGTGTVYNYFPSKSHMLAAKWKQIFFTAFENGDFKTKSKEPMRAILQLFDIILALDLGSRKLMREGMSAFMMSTDEVPESKFSSIQEIASADVLILTLIQQIIEAGVKSKKLRPSLDPQSAAMCCYSIFLMNWIMYMAEFNMEIEIVKQTSATMLKQLFVGLYKK